MTPSTPPRSTSMETNTPRIHIPQTPSTIQKRPLLAPPKLTINNNLKSPEYSPLRRNSIQATPIASSSGTSHLSDSHTFSTHHNIQENFEFIDNDNNKKNITGSKQAVARCLFPMSDEEDMNEVFEEKTDVFLQDEQEQNVAGTLYKKSRNEPGTPSDKLITDDKLGNWIEDKDSKDNEWDTDDENDIIPQQLENPFTLKDGEKPLTEQERLERHNKLILENPDIVNTITYIDKRGNTIKKKATSLKPRALFKDNLED